uniref:BPTI/Kunitz inhibitor domain-containing protein n=1 Tax=Globodera rostochiensis TaxID=31243 RepID=A0A914IER1_GLORO
MILTLLIITGSRDCDNRSAGRRFFFDSATKRCQPFAYLGCEGNENRFETLSECKAKCDKYGLELKKKPEVVPISKCAGGVRAAFNDESRVLACPSDKCPDGYKCVADLCCPTKKDIVCKAQSDSGKYVYQQNHTQRYFYKSMAGNCVIFSYFGALGNANNFETYEDCINYCKIKNEPILIASFVSI